jgi:membrane protease YdiL (CAAX protease family)
MDGDMSTPKSPLRDGLALAFASLFPLGMAYIYFVLLDKPQAEVNSALLAAFGIGKLIQFAFPITYVGLFERAEIRPAWPKVGGLLFGGFFGLMVAAGMFALYFAVVQHLPTVSGVTPRMILSRLQQFGRANPFDYLELAVYICVIHSLAEEYYWRWFVFGWMRRYMPLALAISLSSLAFMLHHVVILGVYFPNHFWTLAMPFSLCVAIGGAVWAWIYHRAGSLYAAWLSHALIDAAIMALGYWMLREWWA